MAEATDVSSTPLVSLRWNTGVLCARYPYQIAVTAKLSVAHHGAAVFTGKSGLATDADQYRPMKISGEPLPAQAWLEAAVKRLKAAPDCPANITDAARRLEHEMADAFRRRQIDAAWSW